MTEVMDRAGISQKSTTSVYPQDVGLQNNSRDISGKS
jgi:hypothetical protein